MTYAKVSGNITWKNIFKSIESYRWKIRLLNTNMIFLLMVWLLTPIILPFVISRFSTSIYHTKYTIVASLAFYMLVSKGINNIYKKYFKVIIISVVIVFSLISIRGYYTKINKDQYKDVVYYIEKDAKKCDLLLHYPHYDQIVFNYYLKRNDLIRKQFSNKGKQVDAENIKELESIVEGYRRVWVTISHGTDEKELIAKKLIEDYNLSYQKDYKGIKLYFFEKRE
jgi:hypothetical protein